MLVTSTPRATARGCRRWHDVACAGRLGDARASGSFYAPWLRLLHRRPLAAAAAGAAASAALGDGLAQAWSAAGFDAQRSAESDGHYGSGAAAMAAIHATPKLVEGASPEMGPWRTARYAATVGLLAGVAGELWFRALLARFPGDTYNVAMRALVDQAVFAPSVLGATVGSATLMSSGDPAYARHRLRTDWAHNLGRMWALWSGGAVLGYLLLPPPLQPLLALATSTVWNGYLSLRLHRPVAFDDRDDRFVGEYLREHRRFE